MDPRLSIVTLGVADLDRALAFYRDVLGWAPASQSVGDVVFFQAGGVVLALYPRALLAEDARAADAGPGGFGGVTLSHNVRRPEEVDGVLAAIAGRGGRVLKPAEDASWGGRSGYFADPDGHAWEVAWNPFFPLDAEGIVRLEAPAARASHPEAGARKRRRPRPATPRPRPRKRRSTRRP
jgi:uncharacterized protein